MGVTSDLTRDVASILATRWSSRDGRDVPDADRVTLGNDAVKLDATVLYADLAESTELVQSKKPEFAAEVYKCYLHCASKIISHYGGVITAFDGDRVMAVYIGKRRNTNAARTALAINHAVLKVINPGIEAQYPGSGYAVRQAVGIDSSPLFVAKTGIRRHNDLVWVGRAANIAAKLCSLRTGNYATWITAAVYNHLNGVVKFSQSENRWAAVRWDERDMTVYKSSWFWSVD